MHSRPHTQSGPSGSPSADGRPDFLVRLGVLLPCSVEDVKQAYLEKVKHAHPDAGGNQQDFIALQEAYERALEFARFQAGRSRWLALSVDRYIETQRVAGQIAARGGRVEMAPMEWLKREIGEDFSQILDTIGGVRFSGPQAGDDDVELLVNEHEALRDAEWFDFSRSKVTDEGISRLAAFPQLRKLELRGTGVGNAVVALVHNLPHLEWLGIVDTKVTWWGRFRLNHIRSGLDVAT